VSDLTFQAQAVDWKGLPAIALKLGQGDSVLICLQGAQVLSWVGLGQERLFLSPRAAHDGQSAIRGGIPVCFPQFNQRGPWSSMALRASATGRPMLRAHWARMVCRSPCA
jgi:glucose-6-phosphate 1-epimerase